MSFIEIQRNSYELGLKYNIYSEKNIDIDINCLCINSFLRGWLEVYSHVPKRNILSKESLILNLFVNDFIIELLNKLNIKLEEKFRSEIESNKHDRTLLFKSIFYTIYDYNAFELLSKMYDNSDARFRNENEYSNYVDWATHGLQKTLPNCKFYKAEEDAIIPTKDRSSDVGYDLTIIKKVKDIGSKTALYDTGIIVAPDFGFYTKIVPRSSIIKCGYMLTNSIGIIDSTYRGRLMICLTKIDDTMPELQLPFRCCQLILDRFLHYTLESVDDEDKLGNTNRGYGGFGSTDNKNL